jgi:SAM-dependent methyltransferase
MQKGAQTIYRDDIPVFEGEWDPKAILEVIKPVLHQDIDGQSVLDIGGNTGGLSLELARLGYNVTLAEPGNPLKHTYNLLNEIIAQENLSLKITTDTLYDCFELAREYDIVVCFGLIYHFRNPQEILDKLSPISRSLLIATQTHPGEELLMINRRSDGLIRKGYIPDETILCGWHITRNLFRRMIEIAGFGNIQTLTDEQYNFPKKPEGLTNPAYFYAERKEIISPAINTKYFPR